MTSKSKPAVVHCKREPYDVYIGRPGPWGNPFVIGRDGTREEVIAKHRAWVEESPELQARIRRELRGKVLACHCAPKPCHFGWKFCPASLSIASAPSTVPAPM